MLIYINELLECFIFILLSSGLLSRKLSVSPKLLSLLGIVIVQTVYLSVPVSFQSEYLSFLIIAFTIMTIMFFCLSCSWKDVFLCYITCYILMIIIQFPYILLNQFVLHISDYDILSLFGILYSLVVAILLKHFCPLHKLYHTLFQRTGIWTFFLANLFACSLIITFFYKIDRRSFEQMSMFFLFSFMILLYMNIVLFNQFKRIRHQEKQLAAYDEYMPMVEQLITQVRARQHHHTNEIQSIISLMYTHKDYDSLTSAMQKYIDDSSKTSPPEYLLKLNLLLVSGFLFQKECQAAKLGIHIHYEFSTYRLISQAPEYVLVELFGILLDNAIEAVSSGSLIVVSISSEYGKIIFRTRNDGYILTTEDRANFFAKGYSKKPANTEQKHSGIGLYHLKDIVLNQYHGTIALWNEGTDIAFEISI